jgi:hypothetical protein
MYSFSSSPAGGAIHKSDRSPAVFEQTSEANSGRGEVVNVDVSMMRTAGYGEDYPFLIPSESN